MYVILFALEITIIYITLSILTFAFISPPTAPLILAPTTPHEISDL